MNCETCGVHHDGKYGSGRFCCNKCARSFATKAARAEINKKVSETLTGRPLSENHKQKNTRKMEI